MRTELGGHRIVDGEVAAHSEAQYSREWVCATAMAGAGLYFRPVVNTAGRRAVASIGGTELSWIG